MGLGVNPLVGSDGNLVACLSLPNSLDPLGYHCVTCKRGSDVTLRHNDVLFNTFHHRAGLTSYLEVGSGWGQDCSRTRPADILVTNWDNDISATFDVTVTVHLHSILVLLRKWACTLVLQQEQLSSRNILKMTQKVLN